MYYGDKNQAMVAQSVRVEGEGSIDRKGTKTLAGVVEIFPLFF